MEIKAILKGIVEEGASDVFLIAGRPVSFKLGGRIKTLNDDPLLPVKTNALISEIYELAPNRKIECLLEKGDDDFAFAIPDVSRFRVNVYKQRGSLAAVIRVVSFSLPDPEKLNIPPAVLDLADRAQGLILFAGPAESGKTTTLACLIDRINSTREGHIITLENPIEYLHRHKRSLVSQREISLDTESYRAALQAALRQSPNVILTGEIRDAETVSVALTAAETGHLVISTISAVGAANAVDRLIGAFPDARHERIGAQLSLSLQAIVSQQLIPTLDDTVAPVFQLMLCNNEIRNLLREGESNRINQTVAACTDEGMISMDAAILRLYKDGRISAQNALTRSIDPDSMARQVNSSDKIYF
ncbi:MAG: PilT/PilU family type 4a pilus ATPase [Clostridiales Family XIII bacterium]|jgi:twitching motility protein PilT|nr:PilT/PilU family type 4a pilus ATPase [Clostridiales Family XIII bacterium]